jgi:hypothetical protein
VIEGRDALVDGVWTLMTDAISIYQGHMPEIELTSAKADMGDVAWKWRLEGDRNDSQLLICCRIRRHFLCHSPLSIRMETDRSAFIAPPFPKR